MNLDDMYGMDQEVNKLNAERLRTDARTSSEVRALDREADKIGLPAWEALGGGPDMGYGLSREVRHTSATGGQKGVKPQRLELLPPGALLLVAEVYHYGATTKYADHNWRKGYNWSWSLGALLRHVMLFMGGEDRDKESGLPHLAHAAFHCLTLLTFGEHAKYKQFDDRYNEEEE